MAYTEQLVILETEETVRWAQALADRTGRTRTAIVREAIAAGRPRLDEWYARQEGAKTVVPYPVPVPVVPADAERV